jgi:hypothetical protein
MNIKFKKIIIVFFKNNLDNISITNKIYIIIKKNILPTYLANL